MLFPAPLVPREKMAKGRLAGTGRGVHWVTGTGRGVHWGAASAFLVPGSKTHSGNHLTSFSQPPWKTCIWRKPRLTVTVTCSEKHGPSQQGYTRRWIYPCPHLSFCGDPGTRRHRLPLCLPPTIPGLSWVGGFGFSRETAWH